MTPTSRAAEIETPVLIAGGSLVGMSSAMLLGHYGVRSIAVERHRGTAIHSRAAQVTQRTMEIFRTVGVEQIVRRKSGEQFVQDGAIIAVETLAGKEIAAYVANLNEGVRDVSPCERVFISQSLLEPLLRARAEELGAELRFGAELVSFQVDPDGVTAEVRERDTGRTYRIRAGYMIAADGAHSAVRDQLGIGMAGRGSFSKSVTIYFRANVAPLLRGRNLSVIYVTNPLLRGFFRFEIPFDSGFLAVNATGDPSNPVTDISSGLTNERCLELVRLALGANDVPIEIQNVMHWSASAETADRLQHGRIFLAGDAAHVMPPNGGFGGNTGVQDAQNLAWKIARVLRGAAGPELLSSYEQERLPVARFTVEQAYSRYVTRTAPYLGTQGIEPVVGDLNVEMGYGYDPAGPLCENPRESRARIGTRAPHVWLEDGRSALDLFGRNYVLLAGPEWRQPRETAVPGMEDATLHVVEDPGLAAAYRIPPAGAVLVRPDGFVGWRSDGRGD